MIQITPAEYGNPCTVLDNASMTFDHGILRRVAEHHVHLFDEKTDTDYFIPHGPDTILIVYGTDKLLYRAAWEGSTNAYLPWAAPKFSEPE
jgi:hypothetical protein